MNPFEVPPGIDPGAAFRLCVQISSFSAKLDDGNSVNVPRKYVEWIVDHHCCNLEMIEKEVAKNVDWGSSQCLKINQFDMGSGGERELVDDNALAIAFSEKKTEQKLFLFVDVEDKPPEMVFESGVSEVVMSNAVTDTGSAQVNSCSVPNVPHVIVWDSLEIVPIAEEHIGVAAPLMDEDAMYEFVGLRAEDERAEKEKAEAEAAAAATAAMENDIGLEGAALPVDDLIPGEDSIDYDRENPPMEVGTIYNCMDEFRSAVRHHAIKGQFELGTEKSCKDRFRGYCKADGCPWAIVGRLMPDKKQVRVTLNKGEHFCASTRRLRTKMASYHWVAEKAIPYLKEDQNMGAAKLKKVLEKKYQVTIGYSTVWLGRQKAAEQLYGTWEESFAYLFRFKAEVKREMPGSVVEIDVVKKDDGVYFSKFFCCFKPSIDGFLNGCRPFLSIDFTALNGRWNGHMPSATALDGHNWMYPVAFGFFDSETADNWEWFLKQLQKAVENPPHLAISSDASKAIAKAVRTVYPWVEHRECFFHLMKNFVKKFHGPVYGRMYPAARTYQPAYHEYCMNKIYAASKKVKPFLDKDHNLIWTRSKFSEEVKCDHITNNVAEVWNNWVKDLKDLPIAELADTLRSKFMELYAKRRRIGEKFEGHVMLPIVVRQLNTMSRQLGHLHLKEGGRDEAEVTEITTNHKVIRHVVNIKNHTCTCREWQVSGKPCPHALALIITSRNPKMEEYLHPYFSVRHFRLAYAGVIKPLTDKSQWAHVDLDFSLRPPLQKRPVGRQRINRIPGCMEYKGNKNKSKGKWQVQCRNCFGFGHRTTSPKCPLNGSKKRKSRAKANAGRKPGQVGTNQEDNTTSTPKRQKVVVNETAMNTSPGPLTRRQLALSKEVGASTSQVVNTTTTMEVTTPTKKKKAAKKKLTPRKAKN